MKKLLVFTSASLLLLCYVLFTTCKKKCEHEEILYDVEDFEKEMLPYHGFDTLTFIRTSVGDTHTFIGIGKTITYNYDYDAADCGNSYKHENYYYTYKSVSFGSDLIIGQLVNLNSVSADTYIIFQNQRFEGFLAFNSPIPDLDSLFVIIKFYTKVHFIPDRKPNGSPYLAYFAKEAGCIKIKFANGEIWELLEFKN